MKPSTPDVVVVGGGLSGLAAATYLSRAGQRVIVLEKAPSLGGRATTDKPQGFALNRGAHALYTGGAASSVLSELGVSYTFGVPRKILARDASGLHPFPASAVDLFRTNLFGAADKAELMRVLTRVVMMHGAPLAHTSAASWIAHATERPKIRQLLAAMARVYLYTTALDIASADVLVDRLQQTLKHPVHYVDGGWQSLVDRLRSVAESAGVEIEQSAGASRITVDGGRATGVVLRDGTMLSCSSVIVATPAEDALHLVPQAEQACSELMPVHIACLDLGLQRLPVPRQAVIFDMDQPRFMTAQSEFARLAPDGGAVVHLFAHLDPREPGDPARERARMESLLDETQPGWREVVLEQRFLPRMLAVGALPLAAKGGMAGRPTHRCPGIDNVYFAGDWVGPEGYLADAALASARTAARLALAEHAEAALIAA